MEESFPFFFVRRMKCLMASCVVSDMATLYVTLGLPGMHFALNVYVFYRPIISIFTSSLAHSFIVISRVIRIPRLVIRVLRPRK